MPEKQPRRGLAGADAELISTRLTARQLEIYRFITRQIAEKGYPPTVREVMAHFGWTSLNAVQGHFAALEKKGFIRRDPGKSRAITILPGLRLVCLGEVA